MGKAGSIRCEDSAAAHSLWLATHLKGRGGLPPSWAHSPLILWVHSLLLQDLADIINCSHSHIFNFPISYLSIQRHIKIASILKTKEKSPPTLPCCSQETISIPVFHQLLDHPQSAFLFSTPLTVSPRSSQSPNRDFSGPLLPAFPTSFLTLHPQPAQPVSALPPISMASPSGLLCWASLPEVQPGLPFSLWLLLGSQSQAHALMTHNSPLQPQLLLLVPSVFLPGCLSGTANSTCAFLNSPSFPLRNQFPSICPTEWHYIPSSAQARNLDDILDSSLLPNIKSLLTH